MKKEYLKPSMKVFELRHRQTILCGSGEGPDFGYTPTIGEDGKHLV
jgi:hypothetical protein